MATTLSYGFINPQNGDKGSTWFPAMNSNIVQLNNHNHDGVTSAPITASYITKGTVTVSSGSWVSDGTGRFRQDVTVPSGFNMDDYTIQVRLQSNGYIIHPSFEKLTTNTFRIYSLDNTLTYLVVFR